MSAWGDKPEVQKGTLGEQIVDAFLSNRRCLAGDQSDEHVRTALGRLSEVRHDDEDEDEALLAP